MSDQDPTWLRTELVQLRGLFPMTEREYLAFLTIMEPAHSHRNLAELGAHLTGYAWERVYSDGLRVAGGDKPVTAEEVVQMRARIAATGWTPDDTFEDDQLRPALRVTGRQPRAAQQVGAAARQ